MLAHSWRAAGGGGAVRRKRDCFGSLGGGRELGRHSNLLWRKRRRYSACFEFNHTTRTCGADTASYTRRTNPNRHAAAAGYAYPDTHPCDEYPNPNAANAADPCTHRKP